jgi:hypothetical protein
MLFGNLNQEHSNVMTAVVSPGNGFSGWVSNQK